MSKFSITKKWVALLLAVVMLAGIPIATGAFSVDAHALRFTETDVLPDIHKGLGNLLPDAPLAQEPAPDDVVRVSIVLEDTPTLQKKYSTIGIAENAEAMAYSDSLREKQASVESVIERDVLHGKALDVVWNLTLAANIISANVTYGRIDDIKSVSGVKDVVLETQYAPAVTDTDLPVDPNMSTSSAQIGSPAAWAGKFYGAGSKVAIIDTGVDTNHQSFDAAAFDYALKQHEVTEIQKESMLTEDEVKEVLGKLHIANIADPEKIFVSNKIPFAFNYVDENHDITHDNDDQGEHGSHVTGIAAANAYIRKGDDFVSALDAVKTQGVAPDAQILTMKVFGTNGGAYDSDYMVAIEDAILLGADSVNLSLGSAMPGFSNSGIYEEVLNDLMVNSDTVVTMSAGNNGYWAENSEVGALFGDDVSFHTGGSPGSFTNSLAVASVDNVGVTSNYVRVGDDMVFYNDTNSNYSKPGMISLARDEAYPFVYLDTVGIHTRALGTLTATLEDQIEKLDKQLKANGDENGVKGKIVLVNRGISSFALKCSAAAKLGAAAVIIVDNAPGSTINMDLTDYDGDAPAVSISMADGDLFRIGEPGKLSVLYDNTGASNPWDAPYYTGELYVAAEVGTKGGDADPDNRYTMSSFSSWGVPGSLVMKPEITAPGGNIYSVNGAIASGDAYENMSGTSMAAPQVTGMVAVVAQYIRENAAKFENFENRRALINSLLMSTAKPVLAADGSYYSVLSQGAGLANVGAAVQAQAVIQMTDDATDSYADGKVKVELGDDPTKDGTYTYSFLITNVGASDGDYVLSTDMFTQDLYSEYGYTWLDTATTKLGATVSYTVNGEPVTESDLTADFNLDGVTDERDAQDLLDYLSGNGKVEPAKVNVENGDVDDDGELTTYDAHLILAGIGKHITVAAGDTVTVEVTIAVNKAQLSAYENGAYVEGYTFVTAVPNEEGVQDVEYSIPILGFYGNWSEPSMFDRTNYQEFVDAYVYGQDSGNIPYNSNTSTSNVLLYKDSNTKAEDGKLINPFYSYGLEDLGGFDFYDTDASRTAIKSSDTLVGYEFALIRNAYVAAVIEDAEGNLLGVTAPAETNSGFYYTNGGNWQSLVSTLGINQKVSALNLEEGDTFTVKLVALPEYYFGEALSESTEDEPVNTVTANEFQTVYETVEIGNGAILSTTMTIDDTKPTMLTARRKMSGELEVTVQDSRYVAFVSLMTADGSAYVDCVLPEQTSPNEKCVVNFPWEEVDYLVSKTGVNKIMIYVADYAENFHAYIIDLETEAFDEVAPTDIKLPAEVHVFKGGVSGVTPEILPAILTASDLDWSVDKTDIAEVDGFGNVTGLSVGEATLTAASKKDPAIKATSKIVVKEAPSIDLAGMVFNKDSETWWSTFNLQDPSQFKQGTQGPALYAGDLALDFQTMYGHDGSNVWRVDMNTFASTSLFAMNPVYLFPDAAVNNYFAAYTAKAYALLAPQANSKVLMILLPETGSLYTVDLSSALPSNICAIAFSGMDSRNQRDYYYMLLENGDLYQIYLNSAGSLGYGPVGNVGMTFDGAAAANGSSVTSMMYSFTARNALYPDGMTEPLLLAHYKEGDSTAYLSLIEITFDITGDIAFCGIAGSMPFGDEVWPVSALYDPAMIEPADEGNAVQTLASYTVVNNLSDKLSMVAPETESAAGNAIEVGGKTESGDYNVVDVKNNTVTIDISAAGSTNGLVNVSYPAELSLVSVEGLVDFYANATAANGTVVFAYADADSLNRPVAKLVFSYEEADELKLVGKTVDVTTVEDGKPGKAESVKNIPLTFAAESFRLDVQVLNGTHDAPNTITEGEEVSFTVKPNEGYKLPESITVTMNGEEMDSANYTYDPETGVVTLQSDYITGNIVVTASCVYVPKTFTVSASVENGSTDAPETATEGEDVSFTVSANEGYKLPESITVTVNGEAITGYTYNAETGEVLIPGEEVTGNIVVTASCVYVPKTFTVSASVENGSTTAPATATEGEDVSFTVSANEGYKLPESITVTVNGEALAADAYTYNAETGEVLIPGEKVTGNIVVTAACVYVPKTFTVSASVENGSTTAPETATEGEDVSFTVSANEGYKLPESITVTVNGEAITGYTYNAETGEVLIPGEKVTGNIVVTAACVYVPKTFTVSASVENGSTTAPETATEGEDVSFTVSANEGYKLPESITVTVNGEAITGYTYNAETGEVLIPGEKVTGNIVVTAACVYVPKTFTVSASVENGSTDAPETATEGEDVSFTVSANEGYKLPESITVTVNGEALAADAYTYNAETGEVLIPGEKVTGNISVTVTFVSVEDTSKPSTDTSSDETSSTEPGTSSGEESSSTAPGTSSGDETTSPSTGDDASILFFAIMGVLALVGVISAVRLRKFSLDEKRGR